VSREYSSNQVTANANDYLRRQCHHQAAIEERNKCNDNFKFHLKQCLNETELEAFSKIEDIALKVYEVICGMDPEKMKRK
jgi:hypothetical protein